MIGKSAVKAAEAAGIEVDPQLKAQIEALKAHQTPEQAGVVDLDYERKAAMVSNLMVVLCGESEVHPVVNTGTLYT